MGTISILFNIPLFLYWAEDWPFVAWLLELDADLGGYFGSIFGAVIGAWLALLVFAANLDANDEERIVKAKEKGTREGAIIGRNLLLIQNRVLHLTGLSASLERIVKTGASTNAATNQIPRWLRVQHNRLLVPDSYRRLLLQEEMTIEQQWNMPWFFFDLVEELRNVVDASLLYEDNEASFKSYLLVLGKLTNNVVELGIQTLVVLSSGLKDESGDEAFWREKVEAATKGLPE